MRALSWGALSAAVVVAIAGSIVVARFYGSSDEPSVPGGASPDLPFRGDFETGDLTQWYDLDRVAPDRIQVVSTPSRLGGYAARFEVRPGDKPSSSGERAEVARHHAGQEGEGDDVFYSFSMYLPADWIQEQDGWRIPFQFHSVNSQLGGRSPVPPLALDVVPRAGRPNGQGGGGLWLDLHGGDVTKVDSATISRAEVLPLPIETEVWHDFVLRVRWDRSNGAAKVWHRLKGRSRFEVRASLTGVPTLLYVTEPTLSVSRVFLREGLYRADNSRGQTNVLYLDATSVATSFAGATRAFGPR